MPQAIISIIKGGLGNQLFTYSAGRAMALRLGRDYYIDTCRGYTHDGYGRRYRLDQFPIEAQIMPEAWRVAPTLKHLKHKIIRAWNKRLPSEERSYIAQDWKLPVSQLTTLKPKPERVLINGYWPDENYFIDHSQSIRRELQPPTPGDQRNLTLGAQLANDNTVFVHARRVRYPTLLSPDYYRSALNHILSRVTEPIFVVFSDDLQWTREHIDFGKHPVKWVDHNADDELADLWLMRQCRHAVVANSSFSWWGAWLGGPPSSERVICVPDHPDWIIRPAKGWHCIPFDM